MMMRIRRIDKADFTINSGGTAYEESLPFDCTVLEGYFSVAYIFHVDSHANARVNIDIWSSPTGLVGSWSRSTDGYNIVTGIHKASGTDSNGIDVLQFGPTMNRFLKLRFTETAGQNAILSAWIITK